MQRHHHSQTLNLNPLEPQSSRSESDTLPFTDTIGPNDEDPGVHARQTVAAIKACNVFIVFLCDAYINRSDAPHLEIPTRPSPPNVGF